MKNEHELRDFVLRFLGTTMRYVIIGTLLGAVAGLSMALLAGAAGDETVTRAQFLAIVGNYVVFGALASGIVGIIAGLLTQPR